MYLFVRRGSPSAFDVEGRSFAFGGASEEDFHREVGVEAFIRGCKIIGGGWFCGGWTEFEAEPQE